MFFQKQPAGMEKDLTENLQQADIFTVQTSLTCASNTYPFGTVLKVTNKENKKSVVVVVTDRGSFTEKYGREIDLSRKAFDKIASSSEGLIKVDIKVVNKKHIFKYKQGKPKFTKKEYKKYLK